MADDPPSQPVFTTDSPFDERGAPSLAYSGALFPPSQGSHFVLSGGSFNSVTNIQHGAPTNPAGTPGAYQLAQIPPVSYTGAFFRQASNFVIKGGTFNSSTNIHHAAPRYKCPDSTSPPDPFDYRRIPLGDLNLIKEIKPWGASGVVRYRGGRAVVRRMYSARIHGSSSTVTAVLYQGEGAEENWRREIVRYAELRHPYLLQLYGIVDTRVIHAAVFQDDLISPKKLRQKYRNSHFTMVYFYACMTTQYRDAEEYILSVSGKKPDWTIYTVWIRSSTGQLCIDLTPPENWAAGVEFHDSCASTSGTLLIPPEDTEIIHLIANREYHNACHYHLSWIDGFSISTDASVRLGSIRHVSGPKYESSFEIAIELGDVRNGQGWSTEDPDIEDHWLPIKDNDGGTLIPEDGWMRINSANVADKYTRRIWLEESYASGWLAQAHHIFNSLDITCDFDEYVFVDEIRYHLGFLSPIDNLPPSYLFLCPLSTLQTEFPTCFRSHACAAYWALDPWGMERLNTEEARNLGCPDISLHVEILGRFWDSSVYDGIRQFHEAKGFDPHSQDAALDAEYPLYRVTCERDDLFAHLQGNDTDDNGDRFSESGTEKYEFCDPSVEDVPDVEIESESDNAAEEYSPIIDGHSEFIVQHRGPGHDNTNDRPLNEGLNKTHHLYVLGVRKHSTDDVEIFAPSQSWNITMELLKSISVNTVGVLGKFKAVGETDSRADSDVDSDQIQISESGYRIDQKFRIGLNPAPPLKECIWELRIPAHRGTPGL